MRERGFSLVEILVTLVVLAVCLLAVVPLFVVSARSTASAGEVSTLSAAASQRMELLRMIPFDTLTAGGTLTGNTSGFFDNSDPDFLLRWRVTDDATPTTMKTIEVWGRTKHSAVGALKEINLVGVLAE